MDKSRLYTVISFGCIFPAQVSQAEPFFATFPGSLYMKCGFAGHIFVHVRLVHLFCNGKADDALHPLSPNSRTGMPILCVSLRVVVNGPR